jgi:lysine-specific histone demethylase 1
MAAIMADSGYVAPEPDLSAGMLGKDTNMSDSPSAAVDEDDSGLSSSGTEVFDKKATVTSLQEKWQLDVNGKWQRYTPLESATSTGISSMSSSVAADDALANNITLSSPSRKRTLDGQLKFATQNRTHPSPIVATVSTGTPNISSLNSATPQNAPKKRGRPPKPKPLDENGMPIQKAKDSPKPARTTKIVKPEITARPRSSIPSRLPADVFASQCIEAATSSRLDPYSLHPTEHKLLVDLLMSKEVTVYLNVRNAILRLWTQNPLCSVTPEEAAGCAKETRFFGIAEVAYRWLIRNGYINFGCVEVPKDASVPKKLSKDSRQRTVVVVGAGVSGLTTARQLESLFTQEAGKWVEMNERPPRVIVLEGRNRIGGRVYSKPLRSQSDGSLPDGLRNTAEMGAMIVTGFEHGNPLDTVIRGQLGLRYHLMRDALTIYDTDGKPIEEEKDMLNTELYTDISDRAGAYRAEAQKQDTLRGDEDLINRCRDPPPDGFAAFTLEPLPDAHIKSHKPSARRGRRRNAPPGTEKLTGRSQVIEGSSAIHSASRAAKDMGWQVKEGVAKNQSVSLHKIAASSAHPTLGHVMDEAITQYQDLINLTPVDMRLLNWHHANLEYANAAPVTSLSLSGHDQDTGNEFEGAHSEIIGGYTQLPRGLMNLPTKLDVRFGRVIDSIHYDNGDDSNGPLTTRIVCTDGEVIEADEIVITAPLGVLKTSMIDFDPPLPDWKRGAISRMGFGLLNKVCMARRYLHA